MALQQRRERGRGGPQAVASELYVGHRGGYLTTTEACDLLRYEGRHRLRSLYRFIQRNGIPTFRRSPRCLLLRVRDLEAVLGAHGAESPTSAAALSAPFGRAHGGAR